MKQTRVRTSAGPAEFQGKSELQRKLQSMVVACRDNSLKNSRENNNKLSNTELRLKRAEAQSQINFAKTSPAAIPLDSTPPISRKAVNLDPLQNCYGRTINTNVNGPKGILTKPSTPKVSKGKRVTFSLDLESDIPSRSDSPVPLDTSTNNSNSVSPTSTSNNNNVLASSNNNLPSVDFKATQQQNGIKKTNLFQSPATPKATRPSLSEQLSAIANKAGDLTADIKAKAGLNESSNGSSEPPLLTSPAKNFTVGNLQCRYPAPAVFYRDRLEYTFHHPFQSTEIHLILYYRDMQGLTLSPNPQPGKIHFRVPRKLVHFASDYDPTKHYVTLYLSSSLALENIRNEILPLIPGRNSSIGTSLAKLT